MEIRRFHFAIWATVILLFNLTLTVWTSSKDSVGLLEGDCGRIKASTHLVINILSTTLLSGSNYCMQCLAAPNRREVDKAHARGKWLDIGIPGIRNVPHLGRQRMFVWFPLALTSLTLHLFFNSAVYGSLVSNDYFVFFVSKSFLADTSCRSCMMSPNASTIEPVIYSKYKPNGVSNVIKSLHNKFKAGELDKLEPAQCIDQYATTVQSNRLHLLLIANDDNFPTAEENSFPKGSHIYWSNFFDAGNSYDNNYDWVYSGNDNISSEFEQLLNDSGEWRLQSNEVILMIITIMNFVKVVLMFLVACSAREEPLVTMGDAVASFLEKADSTTKDFFMLILIAAAECLAVGVTFLPDSLRTIQDFARLGFGTIDPRVVFLYRSSLILNVLTANLPQMTVSLLYLFYNALLTCFLLSYE
ncbi:hypothetical protein GQ44DRAFT_774048 [Phaeosphaeriaceae sp. PMI808]|nr:hypothetical protein GQ44DRAFT_774048 [Phaeosphaeriaceae sp. PMI808]